MIEGTVRYSDETIAVFADLGTDRYLFRELRDRSVQVLNSKRELLAQSERKVVRAFPRKVIETLEIPNSGESVRIAFGWLGNRFWYRGQSFSMAMTVKGEVRRIETENFWIRHRDYESHFTIGAKTLPLALIAAFLAYHGTQRAGQRLVLADPPLPETGSTY